MVRKLIPALALLAAFAASTQAAVVQITSSQLGTQSVEATGFPYLICPSGVNGCGGSFTENIGSGANEVSNATIWCVDSQLDVSQNESYTAYITSLGSNAATFDNSNLVRYGGVTGSTWVYSLSGYGLSSTDALTRYRLASILLSQYVPNDGQPANGAEDQAIQRAIWRLTDNTLYGASTVDLSGDIANGVGGGYSDWIAYASSVLNGGNFNYSGWAVVSGSLVNGSLGTPSNSTAVQTFLVQVTPEPSFYGLLLAALSGMAFFSIRRKKTC